MAYINVAEWSPDQVTDWLKGLDNSMYKYIVSFTNNEVKGEQLLSIRPSELEHLGMFAIGHQEIVLEAVEHLRNFNYHLDKENLQFLALHVATTAKCLHKQLAYYNDKSKIETQILNDITRAIATIKPLVGWLERTPFQGQLQFNETRKRMLHLGIEMATSAQRDRFVQNPVDQISLTAEKIAKLADYIIQDISDPMILQPATLTLVTLKKRESELGFNIVPNYQGIHVITDIKYNSPAHTSGKIEDGDEIVQINYQTVIGWQYKKVIQQLQESGPDVLLTLKKRPKHTKIYGQIYMKPYRLPSKKKTIPYRLCENLPSPRVELIASQNFPMPMPLARVPEKHLSDDSDSSCSDIMTPTEPATKVAEKELRLYLPKPRAVLQRRNTICGDRASGFKGNVVFWHEHRGGRIDQDSPSLRDKSVSFGFGLEMTAARPTTCIGIQNVNAPMRSGRMADFGTNFNNLGSLPRMNGGGSSKKVSDDEPGRNGSQGVFELAKPPGPKPGISKVVRFDANNVIDNDLKTDDKFTCKIDTTIVETFEPIPYVDEDEVLPPPLPPVFPRLETREKLAYDQRPMKSAAPRESGTPEAVNTVLVQSDQERRSILAKSASEPAYDKGSHSSDDTSDDSDSDAPPAIEPRKDFINKTPPVPPRPRKSIDVSPLSVTASGQSPLQQLPSINASKPASIVVAPVDLYFDENSNKSKLANVIDLKKREPPAAPARHIPKSFSSDNVVQKMSAPVPAARHFLEDCFEELELLTPTKTKNLTLKKKNSLLAKRRKISLKLLDVSDIQGHLYRRTKDRHGVTYWAKLYFVLVETALYGFQAKESSKANCLIFLSGFTVSTATEVHSKPFAFKVYHPKKTFYFAAETQQALNQWMDYIKRATLKGNMATINLEMDHNIKDLFSETESSDEDLDLGTSKFYSPLLTAKSGTNLNLLGSCGGKRQSDEPPAAATTTSKSEKYHLGFGSLKKFTKNNLPFTNKGDKDKDKEEKKKTPSDVPQPTAQFRSYRKVPGSAGMQLGTTSMINSDLIAGLPTNPFDTVNNVLHPLSENSPMAVKAAESMRKNSISSLSQIQCPATIHPDPAAVVAVASTASQAAPPPVPMTPTVQPPTPLPMTPSSEATETFALDSPLSPVGKPTSLRDINKQKSKMPKASPYNFIHASNPNLVEFTFQTSKTLDYSFPKINSSTMMGTPHNLQGFCVTLKDLMLQKQEEERQDVYNNRVNLGMERDKTNRRRQISEASYSQQTADDDAHPVRQNLSKIQNRSLPKTPDYAQSFKPDDSDIIMARTKEGQKLRDFGYEFISGDDANGMGGAGGGKGAAHKGHKSMLGGRGEINARLNDRDRLMIAAIGAGNSVSASKKKALNWMSSSSSSTSSDSRKADDEKSARAGSLKKTRTKLVADTFENFKTSSEKLFQFKYGHHSPSGGGGGDKDSDTTTKPKMAAQEKVSSPLKPATSYSPMTLPLNRNASNLININLGNGPNNGSTSSVISQMKKSQTSNEIREPLERKLSAPIERTASYFTKLSFSGTKTAKERKLLGSPRLHRAIFGRRDADHHQPIDHEAFSPLESLDGARPALPSSVPPPIQPRQFNDHCEDTLSTASSGYGVTSAPAINPMPPIPPKPQANAAPSIVNSDYPHLEYPPTFEPETYSLYPNSNASLTLLRRRQPNSNQNGK